jgi:hypothetical protein
MASVSHRSRSALTAAFLSIGASAIHFVAFGTHSDVKFLGPLLGAAGVAQVGLGFMILADPSRIAFLASAAFNGAAVITWVTSRLVGLPLPGDAGAIQPIGAQDAIAALLGAAAMATAIKAVRRPSSPEEGLHPRFAGGLVLGLTVIALVIPHRHEHVDQSVPILEAGTLSRRLPESEAVALIGLSARAPLGGYGQSHDHGGAGHGGGFVEPPPPEPLGSEDQAVFDRQWRAAAEAAAGLTTAEQVAAAGYRQASTEAPGVGTHWVKWSLVDRPFDPGQPSMLLLSERRPGRPPVLVGFSYWVASAEEPEGFAGPNDKWHTHHGMCFVDGWLRFQGVDLREDCEDTWLEGSDLWMLHAWPVSDAPNRWGLFADMNPALCRTPRQTPDFLRCDPNQL